MIKNEQKDFFSQNPIKEFVGAGFEKYRPCRTWERRINNASLYYIADGSLKFTLRDFSFSAENGDVVFLKKSDIATISNCSGSYSSLYYIAFNFDESTPLLSQTVFKETSYKMYFKDILDAHLSRAPYNSLKILQLFSKLLYNLLFDCLKKEEDYIQNSKINAAAEYININYYKNISIDDICKISGYSPAHLRRLFMKNFSVSPSEYIIKKRIEMARDMLFDIPEKTIEEISDLVGIESCSYFCKLFKSKTGFSPNEYRSRFSEKQQHLTK